MCDGKGGATPAERWDVGHGIRDLAVGPDGSDTLTTARMRAQAAHHLAPGRPEGLRYLLQLT